MHTARGVHRIALAALSHLGGGGKTYCDLKVHSANVRQQQDAPERPYHLMPGVVLILTAFTSIP